MDIPTIIFVALLCFIAFFVTATVRRDFRAKERQRRAQELQARRPHRKP